MLYYQREEYYRFFSLFTIIEIAKICDICLYVEYLSKKHVTKTEEKKTMCHTCARTFCDMTCGDKADPMLLEDLPPEIFAEIFNFFSLREIFTAFFGLNSRFDSLIQLVRHANMIVKYHDIDGIEILQSYSAQIRRAVIFNVENIHFTSFINLRSLTLRYVTEAQIETIRPQYLPRLETLRVAGLHKTMTKGHERIDHLLQILLSDGFPRLQICMMFDIGIIFFKDTWTGSTSLHTLNLFMPHPVHREQLRSICPQLRQLTNYRFSANARSLSALE